MRIAHNLIIDHFRRNTRYKHVSESSSLKDDYNVFSTLSSENKNIEEQITTKELLDQMVTLVDYLPHSQKKILNMRIFQDMSFKEIAEIENISINTALGRMRYAILNIRKLIEKHQLVIDL
jgi:RNA polymerase sigma-70 factor (ECF subfamily)